MEKSETFISSTDEDDLCCQQLTGTEPYPGPSLMESASVLVKNWVRQGYNDLLAGEILVVNDGWNERTTIFSCIASKNR